MSIKRGNIMSKKIFALLFSALLLCSCQKNNLTEYSDTASESALSASETSAAAAASETTASTTAAQTTDAASESLKTEEKAPITRDFFNDDVVFEEVMLPVKSTSFNIDGTEQSVIFYEYDAAGNMSRYKEYTYEYDYNPDGTYNSITTYFINETEHISRFDENGYLVEVTCAGTTTNYEYEFDEAGRLIRKSEIHGGEKESFEYTYDEEDRLYEEFNNTAYYDYSRFRHEYIGNIENIYYFRDDLEEERLWKTFEKDENQNVIKETVNEGADLGEYRGKTFVEYKYDSKNRLIYENHTVSEDFFFGFYIDKEDYVYTDTYEYEGDKIKRREWTNYNSVWEYFYDQKDRIIKEIHTYDGGGNGKIKEYSYNDDGSITKREYDGVGVLTYETEYEMIPKIKTDIEYKEFYQVEP